MPNRNTSSGQRGRPIASGQIALNLPAKDWFSKADTARAIGMSVSFVEKIYDEGRISGHAHHGGAGLKSVRRIPRAWLVAYLLNSAEYKSEDLAEALERCLSSLSLHQLHLLNVSISREIAHR